MDKKTKKDLQTLRILVNDLGVTDGGLELQLALLECIAKQEKKEKRRKNKD